MRLSPLGRIVKQCWQQIPSHYANVELDALVVMPNHLHGILALHDDAPERFPLGQVMAMEAARFVAGGTVVIVRRSPPPPCIVAWAAL